MIMKYTKQQLQDDEYWFPYHYVSNYQDGFTQVFNDTWGINYVATIEFLLQRLSLYQFDSLIDIGCGDGRFTGELKLRFPQSDIVGIDYSKRAIELAKAMNPLVKFGQHDITNHNTINKKFDIAVLMEVFEHIQPDNGEKFLYAISRILHTKGILLLTVPHKNKPVEYKHFRHFDSSSIIKCLEPFFDVEEIVPFEVRSFKKDLIDKLLTNNMFILNNQKLRNRIYAYYKNNLFLAKQERECKRLFIKAQKKCDGKDT